MIVSHANKYIFIRTAKTAGTSFELSLCEFCGDRDIITPIVHRPDEIIRNSLGHRKSQNYRGPNGEEKYFFGHSSGKDIKSKITENDWSEYFKFCFERNPWDKVVSYYYWDIKRNPKPLDFRSYVSNTKRYRWLKKYGYDLYTIGGSIVTDEIYLYEKLPKAIKSIKDKFGFKLSLPHAKGQFRKIKGYRDLYGKRQREIIADLFKEEIKLFGYKF